nr:hypothetical protein CFP56_03387 [Quercus suber]
MRSLDTVKNRLASHAPSEPKFFSQNMQSAVSLQFRRRPSGRARTSLVTYRASFSANLVEISRGVNVHQRGLRGCFGRSEPVFWSICYILNISQRIKQYILDEQELFWVGIPFTAIEPSLGFHDHRYSNAVFGVLNITSWKRRLMVKQPHGQHRRQPRLERDYQRERDVEFSVSYSTLTPVPSFIPSINVNDC